MGNDNNEIKENISDEKEAAESVAAETSVTDDAPETQGDTAAESSEKTYEEEPVLDDSDDDLETVDLNGDNKKNHDSKDSQTREKKSKNTGDRRSRDDEDDKEEDKPARPVRRREKKPVDQYKKKRVRKTIRIIVILLILVLIGLFIYFKFIKPRSDMAKNMMNMVQEQTDTIEKRDITEAISTTGTFEASEARTLTSTAKDTTIDAVMASVGDWVNEGDTLVMFSTENINKTITQLQEDLAKQKKKDAIDSQASDRNYLYTYANQSLELSSAAEKVNSTLKDLYEACDGYGTAKRELQAAKDAGESELVISTKETAVATAYQKEQAAQVAYDAAVDAQAQLISKSSNTLTEADENKQKTAITAGDQATSISRQIEEYQDKLENYVIAAPISGVVTSVSVEEGNGFSGGNVMVIQNTDTFKIKALIDEYDINDIKLGQRVVIKTNATGDDELIGYVSFIAPTSTSTTTVSVTTSTATTSNGMTSSVSASAGSSANYEITINVITKDDRIKIGMSAKLNIVVDQVSNVLTVPYDAIMTNAQGENYITVIEKSGGPSANAGQNSGGDMPVISVNGQTVSGGSQNASGENSGNGGFSQGGPGGGPGNGGPGNFGGFGSNGPSGSGNNSNGQMPSDNRRDIKVTVGMEGDYYTQIISDEIEEGMTVVVPDSSSSGGFNFGGMMGGPGMF